MNPKDIDALNRAPLALVPLTALIDESMAFRSGAIMPERGAYNWRDQPVEMMSYLSAALRHIAAVIDQQWWVSDAPVPETVSHLGAARACLAIIIDAREHDTLIDNRPTGGKPGAAEAMLKRLEAKLKTAAPVSELDCGEETFIQQTSQSDHEILGKEGWPFIKCAKGHYFTKFPGAVCPECKCV